MPNQMSLIVIILLVAFAIYRRVRRHIGWQPYSRGRLKVRLIIFGVLGVLLLSGGLTNPIVYASDAVGVLLGAVLAYIAVRTTEFKEEGGKWVYRSNPLLGIVLIAIVLGRVLYRLYVTYGAIENVSTSGGPTSQQSFSAYTTHPLTAGIIFILIAYYAGYYLFLIRKKGMTSGKADVSSSNPE